MSTFALRNYQTECLDSILRALLGQRRGTGAGRITRGAVVLPTGCGKSVIIAELTRRWSQGGSWGAAWRGTLIGPRDRRYGRKALLIAHRNELLEQLKAKVHTADPELSVGMIGFGVDERDADVIVASVQSLTSKRLETLQDVGIVIVDEAHHTNASSYMRVLEHFGCFTPDGTPCIGFTATLVRADKLKPGDVWEEVVFTRDIVWAIRNGFLVDVKGKRVQVAGLDLSKVRRMAGDLQADQLAEELLDADAPEQLAQAYLEHAADRQGVVFWPNVGAAEAGSEAFTAAGIPSALILGSTPKEERELIYKRFRAGELQVLTNVNVLTEGWDMPQVSCVVPARLTQSAGLYMQMVGRGTRPHRQPLPAPFAPKTDCLVLDPVGVTGRHKLATLADTSITLHGVEDEESLLEAAQRAEREDAELLADELQREIMERQELERAELKAKEVSLFAESASTWLQTSNGTWFIPVQDWLLFLWPEGGGLFTVGSARIVGMNGKPFTDSTVLARGMLQDGAMAYAQKLAKQHDPKGSAERTAAWRHPKPVQASRAKFARSIGVRVSQTMTDADVADAVFVKLATVALGG